MTDEHGILIKPKLDNTNYWFAFAVIFLFGLGLLLSNL